MPKITTDQDLIDFRKSSGYLDFISWIQNRSESIRGKKIEKRVEGCSERIRSILDLLDSLLYLADQTPIVEDPNQRFGNKAFRTYIQRTTDYLSSSTPADSYRPTSTTDPELSRTFLNTCPGEIKFDVLDLWIGGNAWGHETRLDYGTGHELAFVLGLWVLVKRGWLGNKTEVDGVMDEDDLILRVFPRYLTLTNHLQKKYKLEPAGSHGVWGLDDYVFLPYLFGSGQLLGVPRMTPKDALEQAKGKEALDDLWTVSLRRVFEFKRGPFFEHSPLLHNLSTTFPTFNKINSGLFKMYLEEVLGKRVVVQHLPLPEWVWSGSS